jgi:hypothetical protein
MDAPFRVERYTNGVTTNLHTTTPVVSWAIIRTGIGVVCTTDDVSWAYLIVGMLNDGELQVPGKD